VLSPIVKALGFFNEVTSVNPVIWPWASNLIEPNLGVVWAVILLLCLNTTLPSTKAASKPAPAFKAKAVS
jgi:hypothetical protein